MCAKAQGNRSAKRQGSTSESCGRRNGAIRQNWVGQLYGVVARRGSMRLAR